MKIENERLLAILESEISNANGYWNDELSANRENALDYYYGKPKGSEIEGRSKLNSMDVADGVNALMAQIVPTFAADTIIEFEPTSEQDDPQRNAVCRTQHSPTPDGKQYTLLSREL